MTEGSSELVTILFTDLVGSTELLARAGDEEAQRIFRAHHDLLAQAAEAHGGQEVKWLGDGLMVAFGSAAGAVRAAVAMQQAARRPIQGERLAIRVGLNVGEALRDSADYFGLPVVVARRLCDAAAAGQILCAPVVAELLASRSGFAFVDRGRIDLKGVPEPAAAFEVGAEPAPLHERLSHLPFVGRDVEFARLAERLATAVAGTGGLVLVSGEAGIGKTRLVAELAQDAGRQGAEVLWGHALEGEWVPPYAPFAEAVEMAALAADPEELGADLGSGAAALAQLVPALRQVLPDLPEPVPLQPDEERFRLLEAATHLFLARSQRTALVVVLEDLHWADRGSVALLRHLVRFASRHRILVVGTYRDAEVDQTHPLGQVLGALPRDTNYEAIPLTGLDVEGVTQLLALVGDHEVSAAVGAAWATRTDGNPFFLKELLRHLIDEGKLYREPDGSWSTTAPLRDLGIPQTVRDVIGRRLARMGEAAKRLLGVAAAFDGAFRFDLVAGVADLPEGDALDALDEALAAQLIQAGRGDTCVFTHALVRDTVYSEISPWRRLRLHRRMALALEAAYGTAPSPAQAGEVASQYHRSVELPGAERGVGPALLAASGAEATGAHDDAVGFLRAALDLCPADDPRRPTILSRLGVALTWALRFDEAVAVAVEAADTMAADGPDAAAAYLSETAYACAMAGGQTYAWQLAGVGLRRAGPTRDVAWARLVSFDLERRAAEDPTYPGIPLDTPERHESAGILRAAHLDPMGPAPMEAVFSSRDQARESSNLIVLGFWAGEFRRVLPRYEAETADAERLGRFARAARACAYTAAVQVALGQLHDAQTSLERAQALAARLGRPLPQLLNAEEALISARDHGWEDLLAAAAPLAASRDLAHAWAFGWLHAMTARAAARLGRSHEATTRLAAVTPWLERAPPWTNTLPYIASGASETLWLLQRTEGAGSVENALRDKVIGPDFRYANVDGRLALARLCALTGRYQEAISWFGRARKVLSEQGARPLLAITDYDEALMFERRGRPGDLHRARPRLDAARRQFEEIGMTGWQRRADQLDRDLP